MNTKRQFFPGGPAFPIAGQFEDGPVSIKHPGMSMLDYFAAAALTGLLAQEVVVETSKGTITLQPRYDGDDLAQREKLSQDAYFIAHEMLRRRDFINDLEAQKKGGA